MTKRDIFSELMEGFDELERARNGTATLRTTQMEINQLPHMTPAKLEEVAGWLVTDELLINCHKSEG